MVHIMVYTTSHILFSPILDILSRKLERTVIECTPRGGSEVTVIFSDNTQRIVKLANENQCKDPKPKSPVSILRTGHAVLTV